VAELGFQGLDLELGIERSGFAGRDGSAVLEPVTFRLDRGILVAASTRASKLSSNPDM